MRNNLLSTTFSYKHALLFFALSIIDSVVLSQQLFKFNKFLFYEPEILQSHLEYIENPQYKEYYSQKHIKKNGIKSIEEHRFYKHQQRKHKSKKVFSFDSLGRITKITYIADNDIYRETEFKYNRIKLIQLITSRLGNDSNDSNSKDTFNMVYNKDSLLSEIVSKNEACKPHYYLSYNRYNQILRIKCTHLCNLNDTFLAVFNYNEKNDSRLTSIEIYHTTFIKEVYYFIGNKEGHFKDIIKILDDKLKGQEIQCWNREIKDSLICSQTNKVIKSDLKTFALYPERFQNRYNNTLIKSQIIRVRKDKITIKEQYFYVFRMIQ